MFCTVLILLITVAATYSHQPPHSLLLRPRSAANATQPEVANLTTVRGIQIEYDVDVTIGGQVFPLQVDTGSSDLWVLASDYVCLNETSNATLPTEACGYGPKTYIESPTLSIVQGEFFGEQLGGGRVSGLLGLEEVTLAGITVHQQHVGIVNKTSNTADGFNSGILGLGYPSMTSAHNGSIINADNTTYTFNAITYSPLINSMYTQGLIDQYFSIAFEGVAGNLSSGPGGYLTLGGLPPVSYHQNFSRVPVEVAPLPANVTGGEPNVRSWWMIRADGVTYGPSASGEANITTNATEFLAVVDTGNFFTFLPGPLATAINGLFEPQGRWIPDSEPLTYAVDCIANAPQFAVNIGGQSFFHNGKDLVYDMGDGSCVSSLVSAEGVSYVGFTGAAILGVPFLRNVVAVFDFGNNEMRFAGRTSDGSNGSSIATITSANSAAWNPLLGTGWQLLLGLFMCSVVSFSTFI